MVSAVAKLVALAACASPAAALQVNPGKSVQTAAKKQNSEMQVVEKVVSALTLLKSDALVAASSFVQSPKEIETATKNKSSVVKLFENENESDSKAMRKNFNLSLGPVLKMLMLCVLVFGVLLQPASANRYAHERLREGPMGGGRPHYYHSVSEGVRDQTHRANWEGSNGNRYSAGYRPSTGTASGTIYKPNRGEGGIGISGHVTHNKYNTGVGVGMQFDF